ncbi:C-C motif chemokine 28-like [Xyrauchen texanus]|uniref:C-C motif chemokine 28-like n=1 Tax=Xyrauchen texanus TaxID=154827 RepID=UPI00224291D3|nr:C-C motif chemokine 28-like [Xyrauchen texanus]
MELKRTSLVLLVLCAAILTSTEGGIPNCCVKLSKNIPKHLLLQVSRYEIQTRYGACDMDAVIIHLKGKILCAHPKLKDLLRKIDQIKKAKKNGHKSKQGN